MTGETSHRTVLITGASRGLGLALACALAKDGWTVIIDASILGPSPQPALLDYPLDMFEQVYRTNVVSPLALIQALNNELNPQARIINVTSDAAVEPYEGWGGYR